MIIQVSLRIGLLCMRIDFVIRTFCWIKIFENYFQDQGEFENNFWNLLGSSQYISGVKVYSMDRDCAMVGGVCIQSSDCVVPTSKKGLCPSNQLFGVECCYEREYLQLLVFKNLFNFLYNFSCHKTSSMQATPRSLYVQMS